MAISILYHLLTICTNKLAPLLQIMETHRKIQTSLRKLINQHRTAGMGVWHLYMQLEDNEKAIRPTETKLESIQKAQMYLFHAKRMVSKHRLMERLCEIQNILSPVLPELGLADLIQTERMTKSVQCRPPSPQSGPREINTPIEAPAPWKYQSVGRCGMRRRHTGKIVKKHSNIGVYPRRIDNEMCQTRNWRLRGRKKLNRQGNPDGKDKYKSSREKKNKIKKQFKMKRTEKYVECE